MVLIRGYLCRPSFYNRCKVTSMDLEISLQILLLLQTYINTLYKKYPWFMRLYTYDAVVFTNKNAQSKHRLKPSVH